MSTVPGIIATAEIEIEAPAERVWSALTDPGQVKEYMFGTQVETDWQVGSPITWSGEWKGQTYQDKGEVLTYDEPRELAVSYFSSMSGKDDVPESYHRVTYRLREQDGTTHLSVSQDNNGSDEEAEHSKANWEQALQGLKTVAEGRS